MFDPKILYCYYCSREPQSYLHVLDCYSLFLLIHYDTPNKRRLDRMRFLPEIKFFYLVFKKKKTRNVIKLFFLLIWFNLLGFLFSLNKLALARKDNILNFRELSVEDVVLIGLV